ncbi:helix-turn-helix domain-containing protein [Ochrovirga pacifica]|uniref:helix-turn-helix domain-containing protein n=1 Tax=Ochrovirga pacifica TaxID=1042376 RepID=UPI0002559AF4|nr:helix-turn-helix domain-containing protein [Ochrovirga pacifica]
MKKIEADFLQKIFESNSFGNSTTYENLLKYLVACTQKREIPKETTIASEVFGKNNFDPSQSTLIRVYMYNLRKKLEKYYENEGKNDLFILHIPKGSYEVELIKRDKPKKKNKSFFKIGFFACLIVFISVASYTLVFSKTEKASNSILLDGFFDNGKNSMMIVGDFLLVRENDTLHKIAKVLRDKDVNSNEDFKEFEKKAKQDVEYELLNYSFLSTNAVNWVKDISRLFYEQDQDFVIRKMSEVTTKEVRDYNLFVVGLVKTFRFFKKYSKNSAIEFITDGVVYTDPNTQKKYKYKPGGDADFYHKDYAIIAKIPGTNNNEIYLLGGIWDTGASHSVSMITHIEMQKEIKSFLKTEFGSIPAYFEMIIEVNGLNRMDLSNNKILHANPLDVGGVVYQ